MKKINKLKSKCSNNIRTVPVLQIVVSESKRYLLAGGELNPTMRGIPVFFNILLSI